MQTLRNPGSLAAVLGRLRGAAEVLRALLGAPDYERYLAHVRRDHGGTAPLSREEFVRQRLEARYNRPGSRCC